MRRGSTARFLVVLVSLFLVPNSVFPTTYAIPDDYRIACLDLQTGKLLWTAQPEALGRARIVVKGSVVIAPAKKGTYYVDARSGKLLPESEIPQDQTVQEVGPLDPLPHNLTSSDGIVFEYDQGNTRNLIGRQNGKVVYTRHLEYWPYDLHIAGHLAIFTLADLRTGGGEVYAYDIKHDHLIWEFDASQKLRGLSEYSHTDIAIDGNRVLVSVDQVLFALAIESGQVLWMTELPRQTIRQYDAPWTTIGRVGDSLLVKCYEDLFALKADDGKLLWFFDAGPFGEPWPTIKDGKAYVLTREGPVKLTSLSFGGLVPEKGISAVKVKRDKTSPTGYSMEFLSRRDIPRDAAVYWSLKPPPLPRGEQLKNGRVMLRLVDTDIFDPHQEKETISQLDITVPLHESGTAYVKFTGYGEQAVLVKDGAKILEVRNPEEEDIEESKPAVKGLKDAESEDATIGLKFIEQRQFAEAIPYLERAYQQDPDEAHLGEQLAYAYSTIGRHPEVISTLEDLARRLGQPSAYGWELLAYSCRLTGEWRRLLEIAEAAIAVNPRSVQAYHTAGLAASQVYGLRSDEAKRYYTKYLELNPNSEETVFVKQLFPDL